MSSRAPALVLAGLLVGAPVATAPLAPAFGGVWSRTRADGTMEFTNAPRGGGWQSVKGLPRRAAPRAPVAAPASGGALPAVPAAPSIGPGPVAPGRAAPARAASARPRGGAVWARENADGTMEFTNVSPIGARWKVLFRTGPGKAAAVRGATDVVPPRDGSSGRYSRFDEHIRDQQAFYGIPESLLRAVIKTESDYDPHVVSSAGASGLMQLMPETARLMGVTDVWNPRQNIMGGARYLQILAKRFCRTPAPDGDGAREGGAGAPPSPGFVCSSDELVKVIAGYHAGPGAVLKYGGLPPYETTRAYVTTVLGRYQQYRAKSVPGANEDRTAWAAR
jgi:soluble lytic murein transglycosylase-like protein